MRVPPTPPRHTIGARPIYTAGGSDEEVSELSMDEDEEEELVAPVPPARTRKDEAPEFFDARSSEDEEYFDARSSLGGLLLPDAQENQWQRQDASSCRSGGYSLAGGGVKTAASFQPSARAALAPLATNATRQTDIRNFGTPSPSASKRPVSAFSLPAVISIAGGECSNAINGPSPSSPGGPPAPPPRLAQRPKSKGGR